MGNFQKRNVGAVELITLQDSWATAPATEFFPSTNASDWEPYLEFLDLEGNFTLNLSVWLVRSGGRTILVDTGVGPRDEQKQRLTLQAPTALPSVMEEAGIRPEEIEIVLHTHLHFDHTGWNTIDRDGAPVPLFANARHIIQRREWDYWTETEERKGNALYDMLLRPLETEGRIDLVEGEHVLTSEVVTVPTPGHTPGHVSFVVASAGERAYILGDAAHSPVQLTRPDWSSRADIDPVQSASTRRALFDRIEQEGALIASGHFPYPGLGHAVRVNDTQVFQPAP